MGTKLEPRARGATELEPTAGAIRGGGGKKGGCKETGTLVGKVEKDDDNATGATGATN